MDRLIKVIYDLVTLFIPSTEKLAINYADLTSGSF